MTGHSPVSGVRYLTLPGGGTVVRTGNTTDYTFEITDQHGTADLDLDYTCQTPTWRQFDPYGNPRSTTVTWVDNRTFLDKITDPDTGLTDIGARWYDDSSGRFISLDPMFTPSELLSLAGYNYGDDNPITDSDPSGQSVWSTALADIAAVALAPVALAANTLFAPWEASTDSQTPYSLFWYWLGGGGSFGHSSMTFGPNAAMTQELKADPHNQALMTKLTDAGAPSANAIGDTQHADYSDRAKSGIVSDGLGVVTAGAIGKPPIDGFLGSYDETYKIVSHDRVTGVEVVDFTVTNTTDWQSFFHFGGESSATNTSDGLGATLSETFNWTADVHVAAPHRYTGAGASGSAYYYDGSADSYTGGDGDSYAGGTGGGSNAGDGVYTGGGTVNDGVYNLPTPNQGIISC